MIVKNIAIALGKKEILCNVSFELNKGDKIGIIGINGSGKSTLLKILSKEIKADSGTIICDEKVSYLKQEINIKDYDLSILEYLKRETGIGELERHLNFLQSSLSEENMGEYDEILNKFLLLDGYNFEDSAKKMLNGLDFVSDLNTKISQLSGGQKIKILLVAALLGDGDILLLDEPTNNLDLRSVDYIEAFIKKTNKSAIIVSHDERFLANTTNKILELKNGITNEYPFSYDVYLKTMEDKYNKDYMLYQSNIKEQEVLKAKINSKKRSAQVLGSTKASDNNKMGRDYAIGRGQNKSGSAIKKLTKQLNNIKQDNDFREKEELYFDINQSNDNANKDISLISLVCGYEHFKTPKLILNIKYGDRVLIEGSNGSGKTALIKTLLHQLHIIDGSLNIDSGVKFGYIEQDSIEKNNVELTLIEYITKDLVEFDKSAVFQVLKNFHINYEEKDKRFIEFSAGQRTKINLAKLSLNSINVLLLDEPTNHLDIEASNVLYDALENFSGTIIAITHNKTLREKLKPSIVLNIENGKCTYL